MATFESYPVAAWSVGALPILYFPVLSINEDGGNRLVERERPYRDGAKLDDTGSKAKRWVIKAIFENSIEENGLDQQKLLYPDVLNEMIASFDTHETGDLVVPTRGAIRVRAESYTREETSAERDGACVTFTFVEDNEDNVGGSQFEQLKINASARRLAEQTEFSATSEGLWSTSLADVREFAADLEAIANFPGDTIADIDNQVGIVIGAANRVLRSHSKETRENRNQLNDPECSLTQRKLEETKDIAGRARGEAYRGRPRPVTYYVPGDTDLFQIGAELRQDPADLIAINPAVDPLYVRRGSTIYVLER